MQQNQDAQKQKCAQAMRAHGNAVYRLAFARMRNKADAEDVFQTTFLRYFVSGKTFSDESHEKAWLLRVCINAYIDLQRSAWKTKVGSIPKDYDVADKSAAPLERNAQESAIDEAMSALSPEQRTAVHLHYFEGYATGEIAQMLGLRPATVRSHLRRARIAMKGQLRQADTKVRKKGQATVPSENESGNKGTAERPEEARLSPCGGPQPTATPSEKPCTTFPDLKASPNNGGAR